MTDRVINYNFFHWGPFLYKTTLTKEEIHLIKNLCSKKKSKDYRKELVGIIRHEYGIDRKKMFPIIFPYINSYIKALFDHYGRTIGNKIEIESAWVNYMTKFESNPMHVHDGDLSFVLFTKVPKDLREEYNKQIGIAKPGKINFIYTLHHHKQLISQHNFFPEVGDLFIFPACLNHYVNSFTCEGERISVSGNLKIN
mgnify:CR=1 FL=1|jgi:hypothetical protein|tara:strand:+ start:167 stop:757 length:591 start_codon:yes stop_codon:yes gene_type:complete